MRTVGYALPRDERRLEGEPAAPEPKAQGPKGTSVNLCIVAHYAWGAISGGDKGHAGGVERQTTLLARWLGRRGHAVSLLTWDEGQTEEVVVDGVRVIKMCRRSEGLPGLRFLHPRWTSLNRALQRADGDLYYQNCAEYVTGQVALWARRKGRPFVYSIASDPDCDPRLPKMTTFRERILYRYGLTRADRVIAQTEAQQRMLARGFGVSSYVLPMPCPGPSRAAFTARRAPERGPANVLWVGRVSPVKRLELLLDVAEALPSATFEVAGAPDSRDEYVSKVLSRSRTLANLKYHGKVERARMSELYGRASLLCCTSLYEGFPNTFLEAWSYGVPVVSTIDPDGLIASRGLGGVGTNKDDLAAEIRTLLDDSSRWEETSARCREHYLQNHEVDPSLRRFETVFSECLQQSAAAC